MMVAHIPRVVASAVPTASWESDLAALTPFTVGLVARYRMKPERLAPDHAGHDSMRCEPGTERWIKTVVSDAMRLDHRGEGHALSRLAHHAGWRLRRSSAGDFGDGRWGGEGHVSVPILTIYSQHPAACGTPPVFANESADLYIGHFANRSGEQWIFTLDRTTGEATLRGGDVDWGRAHAVHDGRVDGLILAPEEAAWLQACWSAARA